MSIPIPRRCFMCRYQRRVTKRLPLKLWHRSCMCEQDNHEHKGKCAEEFETGYDPKGADIVYCEKCYQKEIY